MSIGSRIKNRRTELKMSADELARKIGKDRSTIYRYESGGIDKISVDMIEPLASSLNTTPAYLLGLNQETAEFTSTNVFKDGVAATYISSNSVQVRHMESWIHEIGHVEFTDDEHQQIIDFAKYLLFKRTLTI